MEDPKIVVVNFGSQLASNIERCLREEGFRSALLPPKQAERWIKNKTTSAIILSGGPDSVNNKGARTIDPKVLESKPVLGICYGMQLLAKMYGGIVESEEKGREYGPSNVIHSDSDLFKHIPSPQMNVWASHGDSVKIVPYGFRPNAATIDGGIAGMENLEKQIWGLQFHPEMLETKYGKQILANFAAEIAGCDRDWQPTNMIGEIQNHILEEVKDAYVMLGFSGGRDSTTLAAIASKILGTKLMAVCIDGNQLRQDEVREIRQNAIFAKIKLLVIDATREFMQEWKKNSKKEPDPEVKRAVFKMMYRKFLIEALRRFNVSIKFFMQGTLAPDWIESGKTGGDVIKSHHNVGIKLPGCKSIHPLKHLFKYEITALAEAVGLPRSVAYRQPFPGPGLSIRILHGWPTDEKIKILRWADNTVTDVAKKLGFYDKISQLVVALESGKNVGVKGDERVYEHPILIRPAITEDFMTARMYRFSDEECNALDSALTKHPKIVQTQISITPKPPGTIEFE